MSARIWLAVAIAASGCGEVVPPGPGQPDAGTPSALAPDGSPTDNLDGGEVDGTDATFRFSGHITALTGAYPTVVQVGDAFTGSYTFNTKAIDDGTDALHGNFLHRTVPYGVVVDIGSNHHIFQTNPLRVLFQVSLSNEPAYDTYGFYSYENITSTGYPVSWITWGLYDLSGRAVANSELIPTTPPALGDFTQPFGLRSGGADWEIIGQVETLTLQ